MIQSIVDTYHLDRAEAETSSDKRRVWRMYARCVIEEFQEPARQEQTHSLGAPVIIWRRAGTDDELPVRFRPYWAKISLADLQALWRALERARYRP